MTTSLEKTEEKFQATFNQAAVGIAHVSLDGHWLLVNDKICDFLGYSKDELLRTTFQDLTYSDDLTSDIALLQKVLNGEIKHYSLEKRYIHKNGMVIWGNLTVSLMRDESHRPDYFISVVEDITQRKAMELDMERMRQELQQLIVERTSEKEQSVQDLNYFFNISQDIMAITDFTGHCLSVNKAFCDMLGYSAEEICSRPLASFIYHEDVQSFTQLRETLIKKLYDVRDFENRYVCKNGELRNISWSVTHDEKTKRSIVIGRDVTEERKWEKKIAEEKEKMAANVKLNSLERIAASIAHEINNPLTVIYGLACQIREKGEKEKLSHDYIIKKVAQIEEMAHRITSIIKGLRMFSREGSLDPRVHCTYRSIVEQTLLICAGQAKLSGVKLNVNVDTELAVSGRHVQISQVLLNLINNAIDALENKPVREIYISTSVKDSKAQLRVMDSGGGIAESVQASLFQPFFTTKPVGRGTGLGLSISRQLIEAQGGQLYLDALSSQTCFVIEMPLDESQIQFIEN